MEQAVLEWTTVEDAKMFWQILMSFAKAGRIDAAKLVASYLFGLPAQPIELTGEGGKEIVVRFDLGERGHQDVHDHRLAAPLAVPEAGTGDVQPGALQHHRGVDQSGEDQ